ncbi:choice-of-anchor M domain-containing protein [Streptomyces sp. DSM 44915]|uniref:Choice-of-anchor M domain-containing protein n=1 Tax=Streptomyces chisholmiae TaxID=3075540 RepID=A0ABU2JWB9_9ACTN|nr:choice-of-anchor M domain-containing protein [Streptomyces sp. DSM 44915]MDT0269031.1 choice-of-anchor M domain-containing protein [Streptomyces sp. DSM 44915]
MSWLIRGRVAPRIGALLTGGLLTGGLLLAPAPAAAEDAVVERERAVLDGGHLDLAAQLDDGQLEFRIKDGTTPGQEVWREPNDVILHFDPRHAWQIPASAAGRVPEQLGRVGDTVWVDHSVTYAAGLLWPGWNTEGVPADAVASPVTATFTGVEGPEGFFLGQWRDHPELGNVVGIDIDGTRPAPGAVELRPGVHAHPLWFFTTEGVYRIRLELSATLPTGERVSDTGTLTAVVGDPDPDEVELPAPEEPEEPETPEEPGEPGQPEDPGGPGGPGGPGEPGAPELPGEPVEPGKPTEPGEPGGPGEPGQPEEPGESEGPEGPGQPGGPGAAGHSGNGEGDGNAGGADGPSAGSATGSPTSGGTSGAENGRPAGELARTGGDFVPLGVAALAAAAAGLALWAAARHGRARRTAR